MVKRYFIIISISVVLVVFFLKSYIYLDPDFGWRLATGRLILTRGIPKIDPFSYTMPTFAFVDHAWIQSTAIALLYPKIGKFGLSLIVAAVATLTLVVSSSRLKPNVGIKKNKFLGISIRTRIFVLTLPFMLSVSLLLLFVGVRVQVLTWLLFAILTCVLLNEKLYRRLKFVAPIFFLIWANLHGGFASGLAVYFLVLATRWFKTKRINLTDMTLAALSLFATLLTPYGIGTWKEVWSSVSDSSLRWKIEEWMPMFLVADLSWALLLPLSLVFVIRHIKKFSLEETVLYFVLLIQGMLTRRHFPLWVIVQLPITAGALAFFVEEVGSYKDGLRRFLLLFRVIFVITLIVFVAQSSLVTLHSFSLKEDVFYPKGAVKYLKENRPVGQIFSDYGWGGYLIWKLPEKKVFIDGRMPSWKQRVGATNETFSAFDEYLNVVYGKEDYKKVFDKYGIDTVLWSPSNKKVDFYSMIQTKIEGFLTKFGMQRNTFSLNEELLKDGWKEIYKDNASVIYSKAS